MARIPLPSPEDMTPEQRQVYDTIVTGPRGRLVGPLRAALHSPELAKPWSELGEYLRYRTILPKRLNELAIIVTAKRWNSQLEFLIHGAAAREAGLGSDLIEAIRLGKAPVIADTEEQEIYEFARQIQTMGSISEDTYRSVVRRWGPRGVVELTALIGYYTMVAMTLIAHEIPLPDGAEPPLEVVGETGFTTLPAANVL
jgi:4-carboxymuconolactone decarboxylase